VKGDDELHWSYDGPLGPDSWCELPDDGNMCCGINQSPINIDTTNVTETSTGYYFTITELTRYWDEQTLTNDGHTVALKVVNTVHPTPSLVYYTSVGTPSDEYLFDSLHFHFGGNDSVGAEHTIDGFRNPMEMHTVFYNSKYPSYPAAKNYSDGVVVVAVHFKISIRNRDLDNLIAALEDAEYVGQTATIKPGFPLENLYPEDMKSAYSYSGSFTTPICQEAVQWFVLEDHVPISESQLATYRSLRTISESGEVIVDQFGRRNVDADTYMYNNFRPTQNLNCRTVYHHVPLRESGKKNTSQQDKVNDC